MLSIQISNLDANNHKSNFNLIYKLISINTFLLISIVEIAIKKEIKIWLF